MSLITPAGTSGSVSLSGVGGSLLSSEGHTVALANGSASGAAGGGWVLVAAASGNSTLPDVSPGNSTAPFAGAAVGRGVRCSVVVLLIPGLVACALL